MAVQRAGRERFLESAKVRALLVLRKGKTLSRTIVDMGTRLVVAVIVGVALALSVVADARASAPPNTIPNGGFETGDLSGWRVSGDAFTVTSETNWGWGGDFENAGRFHVWGFKNAGDAGTGELQSATWTNWGSHYVDFLISGGDDIDNLYVGLAVDGVIVRKATGTNDEKYRRVIWDISPYRYAAQMSFVVVDRATGGWGHI